VSEDVELDYDFLMQKALRSMMRDVLGMVAALGDAPGEHHFYIEFLTQAPGVIIPEHLREDYPERMTVVLQHQFDSLKVDPDKFAVTLWFKGKEAQLEIPFDAVTSFADPSVQFGLRFEAEDSEEKKQTSDEKPDSEKQESAEQPESKEGKDDKEKGDGADIVSLDSFRKK